MCSDQRSKVKQLNHGWRAIEAIQLNYGWLAITSTATTLDRIAIAIFSTGQRKNVVQGEIQGEVAC